MRHILTQIDLKGSHSITLAASSSEKKRLDVVVVVEDNFKAETYYRVFNPDGLQTANTLSEAVKIYNSI